ETMGRGQKAVGRAAGTRAAAHLPEMYEETGLAQVLARMQQRFSGSFDFEADLNGPDGEITLRFPTCAMRRLVTEYGGQVGSAVLCGLFHEYWAGLLGAFTSTSYTVRLLGTDRECTLKLQART
ncbi:hypothetical protein ACFL5O_05145, partial [Myxococcota bacterium]